MLEADLYVESFANIAEANMVSVITSSQCNKCISERSCGRSRRPQRRANLN